ncbi:alcohol dehydrogenase [Marmoricola endophyticus]|uniref:alcohol dehydrogenase n=1 Tax=Marmoricola endophyticus TaxID=2040280 RepID=A0A917BSB0_9ACTN|nr:zinc-binding dehydrogenase [Marmoricola endophyticus]GGF56890.1 alcohol dehydrogenase [Marmoricola endophyticus]
MNASAAVWDGHGFSLADDALPDLGPGESLVEVELATICGSDLHTVAGDRLGPTPSVLGHEAVGRVVGTGPGAPVATGARVVWTIGTSCGGCRPCRRGVPQKCVHVRKYGHQQRTDGWRLNGTLASYVHLLPGTGVVRVPEELPAALVAPAGCATATVTCAARRVGLGPADAVVVIGCGMLGLTAVAHATDLGASVVACDVDPARLDLARSLGAVAVAEPAQLPQLAASYGADVVLEMSGHHSAVTAALDVVDLAGRVALVGSVSPGPTVAVDPEQLVRRLVTVVGSHNYAPADLVEAVAFLSGSTRAGALRGLVSTAYSLEEVDAAFRAASRGLAPRVAVRPDPRVTSRSPSAPGATSGAVPR